MAKYFDSSAGYYQPLPAIKYDYKKYEDEDEKDTNVTEPKLIYDDTVSPIGERIPNAIEFLKHAREVCDNHIRKCASCDDCPMFSLEPQKNYCLFATHRIRADKMVNDIENAYKELKEVKEVE